MAQTYGKKRAAASNAHRQLFGCDGNDENDIETGLEKLNLGSSEASSPSGIAAKTPALSRSSHSSRSVEPSRTSKTATTIAKTATGKTGKSKRASSKTSSKISTVTTTAESSTKNDPVPATEEPPTTIYPRPYRPAKPSLVPRADLKALKPLLRLAKSEVESFETVGSKLSKIFDITKIGEGSFAEVFKFTPKRSASASDTTPSTTNPSTSSDKSTSSSSSSSPSSSSSRTPLTGGIIKVIPLNTPSSDQIAPDRLSPVDTVAREIRTLQTLNALHGFTRFAGVQLVVGPWPAEFLLAFDIFRRTHRKRAINASPQDDFNDAQVYALLDMDDAGVEIGLIPRPSAFQVFDVFWTTVILLANAEEKLEFEHRDLHMSNLCIRPLTSKRDLSETIRPGDVDLDIRGAPLTTMNRANRPSNRLGLAGLKVTIIDYTITRCVLAPLKPDILFFPAPTQPEIAWDDMAFTSQAPVVVASPSSSTSPSSSSPTRSGSDGDGDRETPLQMATYRRTNLLVTRHAREHGVPMELKWRCHVPRTNVVWLAYLLRVLMTRAKGKGKGWYILRFSPKVAREVQVEIWEALEKVLRVLEGEEGSGEAGGSEGGNDKEAEERGGNDEDITIKALEALPLSAGDLLDRAMNEGWVSRAEIEGMIGLLEREA